MRVFLSYPMNGRTREECLKTRENMIRFLGPDDEWVDNLDCKAPEGAGPLYYLGEAIKQLGKCDAIMLHEDYGRARGCRVEAKVAREYGIEIFVMSKGLSEYDKLLVLCKGNIRAVNAMLRAGVTTRTALYNTPLEEVYTWRKVGKKTYDVIAEAKKKLEEEGWTT